MSSTGRQLATMSDGSTTWTYTYDADGMRTKRTTGTQTYTYVYNGGQLSQMTKGADTLRFSYDASGLPLTLTYNGTTYYYITNIQGDVIGITNQSGQLVVQYLYNAWGVHLQVTGTMASTLGQLNPLRYRSYVYDAETELYYLQSRYYNPELGRFINADGFVSTGQGLLGNNMFAYCGNNPVMSTDPAGDFPFALVPLIGPWLSTSVKEICMVLNRMYSIIVQAKEKRERDKLAISQTIYGEAGGRYMYPEDWQKGQEAVAHTIVNRYNSPSYPDDWYEIVTAELQFTGYDRGKALYEAGNLDAVSWDYACKLADYMVSGKYDMIPRPDGLTNRHMYFRQDTGQCFDEWGGVLRIAGNVFFYYK